MRRPNTTILVLAAIAVQVILGGLPGGVGLCLGGGHDHGACSAVESCPIETCCHGSEWAGPVPVEDHRDDCGCSDVELGLVELMAMGREQGNASVVDVAIALAPAAVVEVVVPPACSAWRRIDDPGGGIGACVRRPCLVGTVRLNV